MQNDTALNGRKFSDDELRQRELAILEGPLPLPDDDDLRRLLAENPHAAAHLESTPCRGGACSEDDPCDHCTANRRYIALGVHRLDHGRVVHPSDRAGFDASQNEVSKVLPDRKPRPDHGEHCTHAITRRYGDGACQDCYDRAVRLGYITDRGDSWEPPQDRLAKFSSHVDEPKPVDHLEVVSAAALCEKHKTMREPIVDGLLRVGETMNLIAPPKVGKSWCSSDLGFSVAMNRPWLDAFSTIGGRVLIIDNELHRETIASRLRRMADARCLDHDELFARIDVCSLRGRLVDIRRIGTTLRTKQPGEYRLVIVDAFYRALPIDTDENANGPMAQLYNEVDSIADHLQCGIVLIHHASKGSQSEKTVTDVGSGAGAQSRAVDAHLVLRPHEEDGVYVMEAAVRSFPPVAPRCLRWNFPLWTPAPDLDPTALRPARPKRKPEAKPEEPAAPAWDAKRFAAAFIREEPRAKETIFEEAMLLGLSLRHAEMYLKAALDKQLAFKIRVEGWGASFVFTNKKPETPETAKKPEKTRKKKHSNA